MTNTALVVAAHPDDEILGCGATIAKLAAGGWDVHIMILAEGATSRYAVRDRNAQAGEMSELARSAQAAGRLVGASSVELHDFPDNRIDSVDLLDVVKTIEETIKRVSPTTVFTHSACDVNVDHRVIHDATIAATRPKPGSGIRELYFFEVLSSTEWRPPSSLPSFAPNFFSDVTDFLGAKLDALGQYEAEMCAFPHPRSIQAVEHLARYRGVSIGVAAAEAFEVGRIIR